MILWFTGFLFLLLGSLILFFNKKSSVSYSEVIAEGRRIYGKLELYFEKKPVFFAKGFYYLGLFLMLFGLFLTFF